MIVPKDRNKPYVTETKFKGRTLRYSKEKSVIWNKTPYVNLNTSNTVNEDAMKSP
jgi:hypothetical protein